jgi:2-polyprenyl-6-methoxyphenol hydroxylase-like FAD-dependent oxidoreductase
MAPLEVIIIGGGLAGSCFANVLVNKSEGLVDVTLVERDEAGSE